jgi:selenocysteine-specific elongation factor
VIIGTAGHIDHGKTALVRALTGVDGDRLKEEKARGITIELGFAYLPLAGGPTIGFVDVPGHERFVHTMVAGAAGIDFALLVIAADDGVMPQTREHLAIIDLLGLSRGLVVISKADLAGPGRIEELRGEIAALLAGTGLEGAEILPVSTRSGDGVAELKGRLSQAARDFVAVRDGERAMAFRLSVDRVFTLSGVGLVVTGTVLSGTVTVGDEVIVSPAGLSARVRAIHAQNQATQEGKAGDRCSLNLAGPDITKEAIHRGDMVLAPSLHAPTSRIEATLRFDTVPKGIKQWFPVRLHHAAAEIGARLVLLADDMPAAGQRAEVQMVLDHPLAAAVGDRFVIRESSAQHTLGGGRFTDLRPPERKRRTPERAAARAAQALPDPAVSLAALLDIPPYACDLAAFARDRALPPEAADRFAAELNLVTLDRFAFSPTRWQDFLAGVSAVLAAHHQDHPDQQGMGRERLRLGVQPRLPAPLFALAIQRAIAETRVVPEGSFLRLPDHKARITEADEQAWSEFAPLLADEARFRPPRVRDIADETGCAEPEVRRILKVAGRMGWVDQIAHDHFFLRGTVKEMVAIAAEIGGQAADGWFIAAQFRDRLESDGQVVGRKVAIQILDFFDRLGITARRGDLRRIDPRRLDMFG